jgi:hypothetical protein
MLLDLLLTTVATIICAFLLCKIPLVKNSRLSDKTVCLLFLIKVLGGLTYYYLIVTRFYNGGDGHALYLEVTKDMSERSMQEQLHYFFTGWSEFDSNQSMFSTRNLISWTDIGRQLHYRFQYVCCLLSGQREIVNTVLYNFVFFIGGIATYRAFASINEKYKGIILACVFLIPSVWFWCAGIHKDGFVMVFIGCLVYYASKYFYSHKFGDAIWVIVYTALTVCMRYYVGIVIVPSILLFFLSMHIKRVNYRVILALGYILFIIVGGTLVLQLFDINLLQILCDKQDEFALKVGASRMHEIIVEPNILSFMKSIPQALNHIFLRPYFTEAKDIMYILTSIETYVLSALIIYCILKIDRKKSNHPLVQFGFVVCATMFLIIAYIVPFQGALIRYRSEYFPLLFCCFAVCLPSISWLQRVNDTICKYLNNTSKNF